jgi:hypothetical protein
VHCKYGAIPFYLVSHPLPVQPDKTFKIFCDRVLTRIHLSWGSQDSLLSRMPRNFTDERNGTALLFRKTGEDVNSACVSNVHIWYWQLRRNIHSPESSVRRFIASCSRRSMACTASGDMKLLHLYSQSVVTHQSDTARPTVTWQSQCICRLGPFRGTT